jgi:hypothetical protein
MHFSFYYFHMMELHFRSVLMILLLIYEQLNLCIRCVSIVWHGFDFHVISSCYHVCPIVLISMLSHCPHDFHGVLKF